MSAFRGHTRGEIRRSSLAFSLRGVQVSFRRLGLTEAERFEIAEQAIRELRRHGGWKELDDIVEVPPDLASSLRPDR